MRMWMMGWLLWMGVAAAGSKPAEVAFHPALHQPGVITVRFTRESGLRLDDQQQIVRADGRPVAAKALNRLKQTKGQWHRFVSLPEKRVDAMHQKARAKSGREVVNLNRYALFLPPVDVQKNTDALKQAMNDWLATVRSWPEVEKAWPMPKEAPLPTPPDYTRPNDDNFSTDYSVNLYQQYLDSAPAGMGFAQVNAVDGVGLGQGMRICDVEYGFLASHADLPAINDLNPDAVGRNSKDHGTAVFGIMAGLDNGFGVNGLVRDAEFYFARPYKMVNDSLEYNLAEAIILCSEALNSGDIILLEQQFSGPNRAQNPDDNDRVGLVPVEWHEPYYDAIVNAVGLGIVVVEAAANGYEDLDDPIYSTGNGGHYPFNGSKDSGAILVGAASPGIRPGSTAREPMYFTNHGSRVDVFAWGQDVVSTGSGILDSTALYYAEGEDYRYRLFGGTSSASPLITSAAALAQALYKQVNGQPASPETIRTLLKNNGLASTGPEAIGVIPDMAQVVAAIASNSQEPVLLVDTPSGNYTLPMQVGVTVPGASINDVVRYTLDGSEPDFETSYQFLPVQDSELTIFTSSTLKIRAWRYDPNNKVWRANTTQTFQYTNVTPTVATPQISPSQGSYSGSTQVVITSSTPGATIKYRTDGRTIGFFRPGTTYTGPITLGEGTHRISAVAYKSGYNKSEQVKSGYITVTPVQLPPPTLYPDTGAYLNGVTAYADSTVLGAEIRCTTDGSEPNSNSQLYSLPVEFSATATFKCKAFLSGYTPSATTSATYNITALASPAVFPLDNTTDTGSLQVSMSGDSNTAAIRYTTNGAEPTRYSTLYTGVITLGVGSHVVKAVSLDADGNLGPVTTRNYTVYTEAAGVADPTMTPFSTQTFADPFQITMQSDTQGARIFYEYTTDGVSVNATPALGSPEYFAGNPLNITVNGEYRFKIRAYKNGVYSNVVSSGTISKVSPLGTTQQPVMDPPPGVYYNNLSVSISAGPSESIFYTQDGSDPSINPPAISPTFQYSGPVSVLGSKTLKATAYRPFFGNGGIAQGFYELRCALPDIQVTDNGDGTASVSISSQTNGANIRYTTDGSTPTGSSPLYSGPFTLNTGTHNIQAFCQKSNYVDSGLATVGYVVSATPTVPSFSLQPQSGNYLTGETVRLAVTAIGSPTPELQWYKDGSPLAGETEPELVIDAFSTAYAGNYTVRASNSQGFATSQVAVLGMDTETIFRDAFENGAKRAVAGTRKLWQQPLLPQPPRSLHAGLAPTNPVSVGLKGKGDPPGGGPGGAANPIPALSAWGRIGLIALLLMAALWQGRNRLRESNNNKRM